MSYYTLVYLLLGVRNLGGVQAAFIVVVLVLTLLNPHLHHLLTWSKVTRLQ